MFLIDEPIKTKKDDLLNRNEFSEKLGESILEYKAVESIVIALYGEWGSGKSSVLNMALEHISKATKSFSEKDKPLIIKFDPWNFSNQDQLFSMFFHKLATDLEFHDKSKEAKEIGTKLKTYSKLFAPLSLIPGAEPWATIIKTVLSSMGNAASDWSELQNKNLEQLREELNQLIEDKGIKLIIVIDNIDRLNKIEVQQMFQLIKLNANFPNTRYLLAFSRNIIEGYLKDNVISGREYLEKIVQVSFDIPKVEESKVQKVLLDNLEKLIKPFPQKLWDDVRWGNLYQSGLKKLLNSLRRIKRYVSSLSFYLDQIPKEINPIDFIGIESIRIFAPEVYSQIYSNKKLFTDIDRSYADSRGNSEPLKKQFDTIFDGASDDVKSHVKEICLQLFPQVKGVYDNMNYSYDFAKEWRKQLRICSSEAFDKYFILAVPEGEISQAEIGGLLNLANDDGEFIKALQKLKSDNRITQFLERMEDSTDKVKGEQLEIMAKALMKVGDSLSSRIEGFGFYSPNLKVTRVIYRLAKEISGKDENETRKLRCKFLSKVIATSDSLETAINFIYFEDKTVKDKSEHALIDSTCLRTLKGLLVAKLKEAAASGRLEKSTDLVSMLYRWKAWGDTKDVQNFVTGIIKTQDGLGNFISHFILTSSIQTIGDYVARKELKFDKKAFSDFVDAKLFNKIEKAMKDLLKNKKSGLSKDKLKAIEFFLTGKDVR